ncbi:MAG: hypothetical protein K2X47_06815 [Bdellovibrionales bacterium]|nr:hypothetical protein [Bdellovibrionales bacterium]
MRNEIKALIECLSSDGLGRCLAISRFAMKYDFFELSMEEKVYFDLRFPPQYNGGSIEKCSRSEQVIAVQEVLALQWAGQYLVFRDPVGNATYLKRERASNTVKEIALEELQRQVARRFSGGPLDCKTSEAREQATGWADRVDALTEMPPSFAWKNYEGLTFNRFDFEIADLPTPLFDDFLSRLETNREAFMAFIWSLFVPMDRGEQYLWIFGEGQDGKGSLVRLLNRLLQGAFVALDAKDKYWLASCVGKRLGAFNDMVDVTFPMRSQFKQVTGQDLVNIEQKYKKSYCTALDTKFIFTTNKELQITTQTSDTRRCIYVKMGRNTHPPRRGYEQELWAERAGILHKCREIYEQMIRDHDCIVVDPDAAKDIGEQAELKFQILFNQKLRVDENSWVSRVSLLKHLNDDRGISVSFRDYSEFKEWMKRTHGVIEKKITVDGQALKVYQGVALVIDTHQNEPIIRRNVK